jgi:hypothetical protein
MSYRITVSILSILISGCAPKGYHEICDKWEYLYFPYMLDGKNITLLPQLTCTQSHYEKRDDEWKGKVNSNLS